jgi:hypothetical protein|tara:strand:- start:49 stop:624 length:576 start_codon:yes stop_codon:yes gene_type:complete
MDHFIGKYKLKEEDQNLCDAVINWFNSDNCDSFSGFSTVGGKATVDKSLKESVDISLSLTEAYAIEPLIKPLNFLWDCVCQYIEKYEELDRMAFRIAPKFNIQKYIPPTGGYKVWHCERAGVIDHDRILVWMLYLNTVEDGGGTEFKYINRVEKAEKGKMLIWPSDFTHTHRGVISPSEEKYIMTGWYELM